MAYIFPEILQERGNELQIRTRPEAGRRDIGPSQKYWIEKDLVFPVAKGAKNIGRGQFYADTTLFACCLIAVSSIRLQKAVKNVSRSPRRPRGI